MYHFVQGSHGGLSLRIRHHLMKYFVYSRRSSEAEDRQVMSIESQIGELRRLFSGNPAIEIVHWYQESKSAKSPGRPIFDEMIARIERGDARGIIAWAPDRLARNSIDGGRVVYLLDRGLLADIKFATYTFENNSQGKFMLQIMFGQSKYYSDALSENVKRGNRTKIENGWRPNMAPLGYLNDTTTKTIVRDPVHFPLIRKMFELMLTGAYSTRQVAQIARDEWGFRTPVRRRIGGVPLALSSTHRILTNPFYAGLIQWGGHVYPGKHEPIVSIDELNRVGKIITKPGKQQPHKHSFAFTGMIRCGNCGMRVTAEHKVNRYGSKYVYYHCTGRNPTMQCREPSVELEALERQILAFLQSLSIEPEVHDWLTAQFQSSEADLETENAIKLSLRLAQDSIVLQLQELTGLRLRNLVDDGEYITRRRELETERLRLDQQLRGKAAGHDAFEPLRSIVSFSASAEKWFKAGNAVAKRMILDTVGSNLLLTNKKLLIEAAKPFLVFQKNALRPCLLPTDDTVRTNRPRRQLSPTKHLMKALETESRKDHIIKNLKLLREHQMHPPVVGDAYCTHCPDLRPRYKPNRKRCRQS